jgi:hypothetical protein
MKTSMTGLLKGGIARGGVLLVLLAVLALSLAWGAQDSANFRFGGIWIGSTWTGLQVPLDSAGQIAAGRLEMVTTESLEGLLSAFPADSISQGVFQTSRIQGDTARFTMLNYLQKKHGPKVEVVAIVVGSGTWKFTAPDSATLKSRLLVYPPSPDGFPHGQPLKTIPPVEQPEAISFAKRLPAP